MLRGLCTVACMRWPVAAVVALCGLGYAGALPACTSAPSVSGDPAPSTTAAPTAATAAATHVPSVIIDTDLSRWWDDATAIGMANVLHRRGVIRLLGIVSDVPNAVAVAAIDAINTAYGHADIPLGAMAGSDADTFAHGYTDALIERLPHSVESSDDVPEAVELYRRLLAASTDGSVTIVSIGGYTNLAGLLDSPAGGGSRLDGRALIARKVDRLVIMDGLFPDSGARALTNQAIDLAAAHRVVTGDWPTPIAWVDGFGGIQTKVGGTLCSEVGRRHPMRIVYEELFGCEPPKDGNWDAPTLLYAASRLPRAFEELGRGGAAVINDAGGLSWAPSATRTDDFYVHVVDQKALNRRIEALLLVD
jgi:hypothetical protein